jgi:hypothetical protein
LPAAPSAGHEFVRTPHEWFGPCAAFRQASAAGGVLHSEGAASVRQYTRLYKAQTADNEEEAGGTQGDRMRAATPHPRPSPVASIAKSSGPRHSARRRISRHRLDQGACRAANISSQAAQRVPSV